ncbi:GcrA family cell cycle regulator [Brevundimonas diminuta]|uniref:GcrA family cell cycle regulator n=1 Tax=Brevundimonas diminuta TaxID=293 RepID=UPI0011777C7C|nr:GcrA family cell cycle regulator [Brevundimonas diminuta]
MTSAKWTPERTQQLIALWKEGRTAAWIAHALGPDVSRCAVLGKVYRLGLAREPEARRVRPAAPSRSKSRRTKETASRTASRPSGPPEPGTAAAPLAVAIALPSRPTATLLSVKAGQCRWPYGCSGEAGFGLCGRTVARGAFCAAHAEVGYQKRICTTESLLRLVGAD